MFSCYMMRNKHSNIKGTTANIYILVGILTPREEVERKGEEQLFYHLCNQYYTFYLSHVILLLSYYLCIIISLHISLLSLYIIIVLIAACQDNVIIPLIFIYLFVFLFSFKVLLFNFN